ncbi:uncharacterized protein TRIREDRAFT_109199, partial [Trichoderma reesei QM6a]
YKLKGLGKEFKLKFKAEFKIKFKVKFKAEFKAGKEFKVEFKAEFKLKFKLEFKAIISLKLLLFLLPKLSTAHGPTHIIDIRPAAQREREGAFTFPSATLFNASTTQHTISIIERNVLEWRMDPQSDARIKEIVDEFGYDTRIVVFCSEGYTSSLAARELQKLGLSRATDLDGGYRAWKEYLEITEANGAINCL